MRIREIRARMLRTPLFQQLPATLQERTAMILLWIADERPVGPGDRLFRDGNSGEDTGCVLLEGLVEVISQEGGAIFVEGPSMFGEFKSFGSELGKSVVVDVVDAGLVLEFRWHDFVLWALELFSADEQAILREVYFQVAEHRLWDFRQPVKANRLD